MRVFLVPAVLLVAAWSGCGSQDGKEPPPATKPAGAAAAQAPANAIAATVGETKIRAAMIERALRNVPAEATADQVAKLRKRVLEQLIEQALIQAYLEVQPVTAEEIEAWKQRTAAELDKHGITLDEFLRAKNLTGKGLPLQVALDRMRAQAVSDEAVRAFIESSPVAYFDETEVTASHILIGVDFYAPRAAKAAARQRLEAIAADVKAGKVSFEDAARQHSSCPSAAKGGDLGSFTFDRMVEPFASAAFAMKVGEVSGVVETRFGFHLIKVTGRTEGTGKPGPGAGRVASQALLSRMKWRMISEALKTNPVTVYD